MQTFYVDVYFLINFTVDLIALYFAAIFSLVPTSTPRIVFGSFIGAAFAVCTVFLPDIPALKLALSAFVLVLVGVISTKRVRFRRKIKFMFSFLIFESLVGGGVYFLWGILDKFIYDKVSSLVGTTVNRKVLLFAIIVLLSVGVFKMLVAFFNNSSSEQKVKIEINFMNRVAITEAFVDSGNLALDPMDMCPVLLLKPSFARELFSDSVINLSNPDKLGHAVRKRIRLIPISRGGVSQVLVGMKADSVTVIENGLREEVSVTLAIDKEGGSFGGYDALISASVICDAKK